MAFFPDPETADEQGLVAVTPRMTPELVLEAYARGIFPWSSRPVRWYSPDPRAVFLRERIHLPRRLMRELRRGALRVTFDTAFSRVIRSCAEHHAREGAWISDEFVRTYGELHERGYAHSAEVWDGEELVGGLYGIQLRGLYAGESMFYRVPNASKIAFAHLVRQLDAIGNVLFDAQVINEHTHRLGAVLVHRHDYLRLLRAALGAPVPDGAKWPADSPPWPASDET